MAGFHPIGRNEPVFHLVGQGRTAEGVIHALTVIGYNGVDKDDLPDAVGYAVHHAGDHHPAVAVADEDNVMQIFPEDEIDDVGDVRGEVDVRTGKVHPFAETSESGPVDLVTVGAEQQVDLLPLPPAAPRPVYKHKRTRD